MKGMRLVFIIALALPLLSASSGLTALKDALSALCTGLTSMLPVAGMLMTLLAAVIYAAGQMMGAETRARANVWATAALTGAMMAILISVIAPSVIGMIYGSAVSCSGSPGGGGGGGTPSGGEGGGGQTSGGGSTQGGGGLGSGADAG
ncbi:MAG: hypothetical protein NTX79_01070 [Candidatus Micrarchaeota archaeon]|nr:hypothetical protein [Candidatus Micrarchaeota archaeon]